MAGAAFFALALTAGGARAADAHPITIAPQPLDTALNELGSVGNQQILIRSDVAAGKTAHAVNEAPTFEAALLAMLDGTGLTWRREGATYLIVSASDPQSGSAAGGGADAGTVQALIVTAQKREENIQDVPIAMSAFTQEDLTKSQVAGGPDLMTQIPNFTFTKTNFSSYSIQIRGIGTQAISATVDPAVAVAFNNTPFIRNRFFEQEFYDLQRVEVLRGPQGTLYGRNATAGVVNIISAKPDLNHFDAKVSADVGNYSSRRFEGMVNLPIAEGVAAFRLAGAWTKRDGYDTNEITGNSIDGRDLWSARASLRFEPTDWFRANLIYEHFDENDDRLRSGKQLCKRDTVTNVNGVTTDPASGGGGGPDTQRYYSLGCQAASLYSDESFQVPNGFALPYYTPFFFTGVVKTAGGFEPYTSATQSRDLRVIESTVDPKYRAKSDLAEFQLDIDLTDHLTLTSETGYNNDDLSSMEDFNRFNTTPGVFTDQTKGGVPGVVNDGVFCDPQIGCADRLIALDLSTAKSRQLSQEFRLSSNFDGPVNFSLGTNFLRYDTEDKYYVFINMFSLFAAIGATGIGSEVNNALMPPYVANVSDNSQCLQKGMIESAPITQQDIFACIYIDPNPLSNLNDQGHNYFLSRNPYKLISYAAFGEMYYNITPTLKLTAGLRWTVDKKEAPRIPSWLLAGGSVGYPVLETVRQEWREPTGRLTLDWKPDLGFTDETLLYASYAHGYKAGGANPPPALIALSSTDYAQGVTESVIQPKTFNPEFINAFEVGSKNVMDDGRLTLNLAAFYYDYTDYQISQIVNRSAVNYNFDAKIWGLEAEADWRPLENLRLGLKLGYERTRVANGEQAIDIRDRLAGHGDWMVVRPFPTVPSNCVLPNWVITWNHSIHNGPGTSFPSGLCAEAYLLGHDPLTGLPYVPNPTVTWTGALLADDPSLAGYPGWDPSTAPNHGEGFFTDLSGHELPNAPHITTTLTADYTLPLPNNWLMTLHSDFYYQSEAWARIFNTPGYDKLKAYYNVNLAAIFSNEDAGWQVMAYVKNVLDADNITGAFLNSDDTGLTTNVFLNEPRLYGLRVTKQWTGQPWWTGSGDHSTGPYPLTVELTGSLARIDAPNGYIATATTDKFRSALNPQSGQNQDLDWGDGREVKLTYRPGGSWYAAGKLRFGRTNHTANELAQIDEPVVCGFAGISDSACLTKYGDPAVAQFFRIPTDYNRQRIVEREDFTVVDFTVGKDVGFGALSRSSVEAGLRYGQFESRTQAQITGIPSWDIPAVPAFKYEQHHRYSADLTAKRQFEGEGPVVDWNAAQRLFGTDQSHLDLAWSVGGGVLFGKQPTRIDGSENDDYFNELYFALAPRSLPTTTTTPVHIHRDQSATVPVLDLSAGLSWQADRIKVGAGYRWERYYNAIDGGYQEHKSYDRTIDGPYFKVSVGFGG